MRRESLVPVPDEVPAEIAAVLGCAVLTGGGAVINAGQPAPEDDVVGVGLGGVGMAAVLTAAGSRKGGRVIAVDVNEDKLTMAKELGADVVNTPEDTEADKLRAPVVVEAAGHEKAFETAVNLTAMGGTTVTVGLPHPEAWARISPAALTGKARTIKGCYRGSAVPSRDIPIYAQMYLDGNLAVDKLISSRIRLADINEAIELTRSGEALKVVLKPTLKEG